MLARYWGKRREKTIHWWDYRRRELDAWLDADRNRTNGQATVSLRQLGRLGRFGNWLFQYMFLKCYAAKNGLRSETPHWPGHQLFDCNDPLLSTHFPRCAESDAVTLLKQPQAITNVDLVGYFQLHTSHYAPYQEYIREVLTPHPRLHPKLIQGFQPLAKAGRTLVALHVRRGDFGEDQFYITPTSWYRDWLTQVWPTLNDPVLYVASDEPDKILQDFSDFHPWTSRDLKVCLPQAPYFMDFYVLTRAQVLAIPNSTFSFAAAMLNRACQVYRSHLSDPLESPPFRRIDPWNSSVLDRQARVEHFPEIPGIRRAHVA